MEIGTPPDSGKVNVPDQDSWGRAIGDGFKEAYGDDFLNNWFFGGLIRFAIWVLEKFIDTFEYVIGHFIGIMTAFQGKAGANYYPFVGAIMQDVLQNKVSGSAIAAVAASKGDVAANRVLGASLLNQLQKEFSETNTLSEAQGAQALETFLGFLMAYAVSEGNLEVFTSIGDSEILKPFLAAIAKLRAYPSLLARNLGLSRLARAAMHPLINTLIRTPYQWNLNRAYRPTKLSEATFVKALHKSTITPEVFQAEMERLGYSDAYIKIVEEDNRRGLTEGEIAFLFHEGKFSEAEAKTHLQHLGFSEENANLYLLTVVPKLTEQELLTLHVFGTVDRANVIGGMRTIGYDEGTANTKVDAGLAARAQNEIDAYVATIVDQANKQEITIQTLTDLLAATPLTAKEREWILARVNIKVKHQSKAATLAQMETFYKDGLIDLDTFRAWLTTKGYGPEERTWFVEALLLSMDKAKTAKHPKGMSLSELRKALKGTLITLDQFKTGCQVLGYADDSIDIFVQEATGQPEPGA